MWSTTLAAVTGSSPRVRGTYCGCDSAAPYLRFIPTSAGNIFIIHNKINCRSVHPHECGEHRRPQRYAPYSAGSSPRVRGTLISDGYKGIECRFIPTSAGNIASVNTAIASGSVHPHECGEHTDDYPLIDFRFGSSPRVRGTLLPSPALIAPRRFIPTSAGNIASLSRAPLAVSVHPHECGEHDLLMTQ